MYNSHRGMGAAPGSARLNELLDGVRAEFEAQARASGEYEHSSQFPRPFNRFKVAHMQCILCYWLPHMSEL